MWPWRKKRFTVGHALRQWLLVTSKSKAKIKAEMRFLDRWILISIVIRFVLLLFEK